MQRILFKSTAVTAASIVMSVGIIMLFMWPTPGDALLFAALCPLLIAFPASAYTFWQNERLRRVHDELRAAYAALETAHGQVWEKAQRDGMTGFLNREAFFRTLDATRRRTDRGALLLVDADHFKRINDVFGHLVGDEALLRISAAIRTCVRDTDTVGRIGGEEFAVLLPGATPAETEAVAERIRREVEAIRFVPAAGRSLALTVSVGGIACHPEATVADLMRAADGRLYAAKDAGRNRVVLNGPGRLAA